MSAAGTSPRRGAHWVSLAALLGCFTAHLVGAQLPRPGLLIVAASAGLALDLALRQWYWGPLSTLARLHCDETVRQLARDLLTLVAVVRLADLDGAGRLALVGGLLGCYGAHLLIRALALLVRRARTLPLLTRNIDTTQLGLSPAPPPLLAKAARRQLLFSVPATAGMLGSAATGHAGWALAGVGISLALFAAGAAYLARWLLPGMRPPGEQRVVEWFARWLQAYRPDVGLYFSGGSSSAYQATMWLSTLAALDGRPLIVLRERGMMQLIPATEVPVVCLPRVAHLMMLEHSTLKVLLHPANAPKTSQVLRIPTLKHAFINHGESDKLASCNPYARVYDQVWVAGPAARRRYQLAEVGVDDADVVEVGRPQLACVRRWQGPPPAGEPITVLYAPTWEGWTDDPGNTSLLLAGESLVRALLADPRVRLLYKPHPLTGSVDPRAGAADARVRTLITRANTTAAAARHAQGHGRARERERARDRESARELQRRTDELTEVTWTAFRPGADDMERMGLQGPPPPGRAAAVEAAADAWRAAFWAAQPPRAHLVLAGRRPDIYSCFNEADLLVSDVSSVLADFLASTKPYAVVNTSGLPAEEFRAANPTVRAATILTPDASGVTDLLATVADPTRDALAERRGQLKAYLLGPQEPPSLERFRQATRALCAEAEARRERLARRAAAGLGDPPAGGDLTSPAGPVVNAGDANATR